jgi:hypothetical protein
MVGAELFERRVILVTQKRWGEFVAAKNGGDGKVLGAGAALREVWPPAAIGLALALKIAWIGALG